MGRVPPHRLSDGQPPQSRISEGQRPTSLSPHRCAVLGLRAILLPLQYNADADCARTRPALTKKVPETLLPARSVAVRRRRNLCTENAIPPAFS